MEISIDDNNNIKLAPQSGYDALTLGRLVERIAILEKKLNPDIQTLVVVDRNSNLDSVVIPKDTFFSYLISI